MFFRQALAHPDRAVLSDPYVFESIGRPGISASKLIRPRDGITVVGADLNLDGFSSILAAASPGVNGVAMIIDADGNVVAAPDVDASLRRVRHNLTMARVVDYPNDAVQEATRNHIFGKVGLRTRFRIADGTEYLAPFTPFPDSFGKRWEMMLVVPSGDFVGPLQQTTAIVMSFAALILVTGLMAIRVLSTNIRHSIDLLIDETDRLRRLDLSHGNGVVASRITEILALAEAIAAMKTALDSFVRFVPRTLVTELLATGRAMSLGGENREVTVMFTDLVNFSTIAEQVSARDLTLKVSEYFQAVSEEVIRNHGTIDKYVGDAVMALWNAPQAEEDHVAKACRAALRAQQRMIELNARWKEQG